MDIGLSQRAVEQATGRAVSNAYLSQLESGKVTRPSPHVLQILAEALSVSYEALMERAGYMSKKATPIIGRKAAATYSVDNLTAEEESALLDYLSFIRSKK